MVELVDIAHSDSWARSHFNLAAASLLIKRVKSLSHVFSSLTLLALLVQQSLASPTFFTAYTYTADAASRLIKCDRPASCNSHFVIYWNLWKIWPITNKQKLASLFLNSKKLNSTERSLNWQQQSAFERQESQKVRRREKLKGEIRARK